MDFTSSSAALFVALPRALELSCLTVLPIKDMLAFDTTSHGMRQLCADDVLWRPIYEEIVNHCCLEGVGIGAGQQQRDLEAKQQQLLQQQQQQPSYKGKTLIHLLAFFIEEIQRAEQILQEALDEDEYNVHNLSPDSLDSIGSDYQGDGTPDFDVFFKPNFDNWGDEEFAEERNIARLRVRIKAITKALQQHN